MRGSVFIRIVVCYLSFSLCFDKEASPQQLSDTLRIEAVSISQKRPVKGEIPGVKIIKVDSLVIADKVTQNLADLLQENSPLFIKTYGRGSFATASMRGTGASHTQVYWNGLNINSPMTGDVDFSTIPIYTVDNISIHFGQSSMVLGSGGLGGAISLESNTDWNNTYGIKLHQAIGSFYTFSSAINASYKINSKIKLQTRLYSESSENNFPYRNTSDFSRTNPVERQKNADYKKMGLLQEVYYKPNDNDILSLKVWLNNLNRSIPKLMVNMSSKETNRQDDENILGVVRWKRIGNRNRVEMMAGFSNKTIVYSLIKYPVGVSPEPIIDSRSKTNSFTNHLDYQVKLNRFLNIETGYNITLNIIDSHDKIVNSGYSGERLENSMFGKVQVNPVESISLNILVREELTRNTLSPILPAISGEYKPFKNIDLIFKSSFAINYRQPSLNDLYWTPGGNPNLKSEKNQTIETGIKLGYQSAFFAGNLEFTAFSSNVHNWILWLPGVKGYWEPMNLSEVNNHGLEASLENKYHISDIKLLISGSYSYTKTTFNGNQLPFIPIHSAGISTTLGYNKIHINHSFTYCSERFTTTSNNPNSIKRLYPYFMNTLSIGISEKIWKANAHFLLRIDNLFDESYQSIFWRPMPGRYYTLSIRIDLWNE